MLKFFLVLFLIPSFASALTLSWTPPAEPASDIAGYAVYYAPVVPRVWKKIADTTETSVPVTVVDRGVVCWRVMAKAVAPRQNSPLSVPLCKDIILDAPSAVTIAP